ncbi:hypothetical protein phiYS61_38 [Weissella phage phiYS61]|uniref:kinase n=1 Tax=Weissella phage phiYS61 TaxID=1161906 RepID=UPI000274E24D|nr:kinase [Weissella phage phiYS61]AFF27996.1 hypothetical protein phiYS61_38 [Weissella phage phiYS61]
MADTAYRVHNEKEAEEVLVLLEELYGNDIYSQGSGRDKLLAKLQQNYWSDGFIFPPYTLGKGNQVTYSSKEFGREFGKGRAIEDLKADVSLQKTSTGFDPVHEPAHYHLDDKGTELKDLMPALLFKFKGVEAGYVFNMIKYAVRQKDNRIQDLEKVIEYAQMAIDELKSQKEDK